MKRRSVGTLTMGILLVVLGIYMFVMTLFNNFNPDLIIYLCPILLICLGGEVLYYLFKNKGEEEPQIKYDFFSIILISFIMFCSLVAYTLLQSGIIPFLQEVFNRAY